VKGSGTEGTSSDPALGKTLDERGATAPVAAVPKWLANADSGRRFPSLRAFAEALR